MSRESTVYVIADASALRHGRASDHHARRFTAPPSGDEQTARLVGQAVVAVPDDVAYCDWVSRNVGCANHGHGCELIPAAPATLARPYNAHVDVADTARRERVEDRVVYRRAWNEGCRLADALRAERVQRVGVTVL